MLAREAKDGRAAGTTQRGRRTAAVTPGDGGGVVRERRVGVGVAEAPSEGDALPAGGRREAVQLEEGTS